MNRITLSIALLLGLISVACGSPASTPTVAPTDTVSLPTDTPEPPSPTEAPTTATEAGPTPTAIPPTATEPPPTSTVVPPTATEALPTPTDEPMPTESAPTPTEADASSDGSGDVRVIEIEAHSFAFVPTELNVEQGETVKFVVTSADIYHTFSVKQSKDAAEDLFSVDVFPGEPAEVTWTFEEAGELYLYCKPHEPLDMIGSIQVH